MNDDNPYLVPNDTATTVKNIARQSGVPDDVADDYLKLTKVESGQNVNVRNSPKGARGFGQVMPDVKGGRIRTVDNQQYDLTDPVQNITAGLKYFHSGGSDPISRRLQYFGGPRARQHYEGTGRIPNISDGNMTAKQYLQATGGFQQQKPSNPYLVPNETPTPAPSDYLVPNESQAAAPTGPSAVDPTGATGPRFTGVGEPPPVTPQQPEEGGIVRSTTNMPRLPGAPPPPAPLKFEVDQSSPDSFAAQAAVAGINLSRPEMKAPPSTHPALVGKPITAQFDKPPDANTFNDAMAAQIGPAALRANQKYREETGRNLLYPSQDIDQLIHQNPDTGKWEATSSPSQGLYRAINAYNRGGLPEAQAEAKRMHDETVKSAVDMAEPAATGLKQAIRSGVGGAAVSDAQYLYNITTAAKALYTASVYGTDSPEYRKLEKWDQANQAVLSRAPQAVQQPEGFTNQVVAGLVQGGGELPQIFAAGGNLPVSAYIRHLNEGQVNAGLEAIKMLPVQGAFNVIHHGVGDMPWLKRQVVGRAAGGTVMAGQELAQGETDPRKLAQSFAIGAAFPVGKGGAAEEAPGDIQVREKAALGIDRAQRVPDIEGTLAAREARVSPPTTPEQGEAAIEANRPPPPSIPPPAPEVPTIGRPSAETGAFRHLNDEQLADAAAQLAGRPPKGTSAAKREAREGERQAMLAELARRQGQGPIVQPEPPSAGTAQPAGEIPSFRDYIKDRPQGGLDPETVLPGSPEFEMLAREYAEKYGVPVHHINRQPRAEDGTVTGPPIEQPSTASVPEGAPLPEPGMRAGNESEPPTTPAGGIEPAATSPAPGVVPTAPTPEPAAPEVSPEEKKAADRLNYIPKTLASAIADIDKRVAAGRLTEEQGGARKTEAIDRANAERESELARVPADVRERLEEQFPAHTGEGLPEVKKTEPSEEPSEPPPVQRTPSSGFRKAKPTDQLHEAVQAAGGIRWDSNYGGELKDIKESGKGRLLNDRSGKSINDMAIHLAEEGYGRGIWWEGDYVTDVDPHAFLDALRDDARGVKKLYAEGVTPDFTAEEDAHWQSQMSDEGKAEWAATKKFANSKAAQQALEDLANGDETAERKVRAIAKRAGISTEEADSHISEAKRRAGSRVAPESGGKANQRQAPEEIAKPEGAEKADRVQEWLNQNAFDLDKVTDPKVRAALQELRTANIKNSETFHKYGAARVPEAERAGRRVKNADAKLRSAIGEMLDRSPEGAPTEVAKPLSEGGKELATPPVETKPSPEIPDFVRKARERKAAREAEKAQGIRYKAMGADPYELIDNIIDKGYDLYTQKVKPTFEEWSRKLRDQFGPESDEHLAKVWTDLGGKLPSVATADSIKESLRLPLIEQRAHLNRPFEMTYESESGKQIVRKMTVGERQDQLVKKERMLERLVDCLHA